MVNSIEHESWILNLGLRPATSALVLAIAFALTVVASPVVQAQTFSVIHNFTGAADGGNPHSGVTMDRSGNLYGTVPTAPVPAFTTFNAPGAGTGTFEGTGPTSINTAGDVTGIYGTAGNVAHGFLRAANGTVTDFDAPGAGKGNDQGTFPFSINDADVITGYYSDASSVYHGFVRAANGTITSFDAPGAGLIVHDGTTPTNINTAGVIVGTYRDENFVYHGFVRASNGAITAFDAPGAGTDDYQGTKPVSINAAGVIAGGYQDTSYVYHGFVRAANGAITEFDVPGSGCPGSYKGFGSGTEPITIDAAGDIAGNYTDTNCTRHGFVRAANGAISSFDAPGAGTGTGMIQGTGGFSINATGAIVGASADANGVLHGFVRAANGTITSFDVPGAGTGMLQGTAASGINAAGEITGVYLDASSVGHGFLLAPPTADYGAVYKLTHKGSAWLVNLLSSFTGADGANPEARVIIGPNGTLYGTTINGGGSGNGTVLNLRPKPTACLTALCAWEETLLYSFLNGADGAYPAYGDVIFDPAGNLYGTTSGGGNPGLGTVYELMPSGNSWTESVLYSFSGSDGAIPFSGLLRDPNGNLYGTTTAGGSGNWGTVFELTFSAGTGWTERVLYKFQGGSDGSYPTAGLMMDPAGNLYGATSDGGSGGGGTIFKLTPSGGGWTYSLLYSFGGGANCGPWGTLVPDASGNLYGTTVCDGANNMGSVFKLAHSGSGWSSTSLHDFTGGSDGKNPYGNVTFDGNGNLYGTASAGGSLGYGLVWEITP